MGMGPQRGGPHGVLVAGAPPPYKAPHHPAARGRQRPRGALMRFSAFLTAAILAMVPVAAWADDPPVQIVDSPVKVGDSLHVGIWIAYGYGKQILNDNDWADDFGINTDNSAKKDGDVVVRFDSDVCNDIPEVSLVQALTNAMPNVANQAFFGLDPASSGWLWLIELPLSNCSCDDVAVELVFHCSNGKVHTTCSQDGEGCDRLGTVAVQALNRPVNEKCTTDLNQDGRNECDYEDIPGTIASGPMTSATPVTTVRWTSNADGWTFPNGACTDQQLASDMCVAVCNANQNGPQLRKVANNGNSGNGNNGTSGNTTVTCGYGGIITVTPVQDCNNECIAVEDTSICTHPGNNPQAEPTTPTGGTPTGADPNPPRVQKIKPAQLHTPTMKTLKHQPKRFDGTKRPHDPIL